MMDAQHISQDDLALYALQALSSEESAAVREHLSVCDVCRAEVASLQGDLAMVALSVDQQTLPSGARERFLQRIGGDVRQGADGTRRAEPISIERAHGSRSAAWIGWVAAAAALIVAAWLGFEVNSLRSRLQASDSRIATLETSESQAKQVAELLTAPSAQKVVLTAPKTPPAPSGRVVYLASRGGLILQASNLAPIPAGKTYELWVIPADGTAPIPAGLFRPDTAGNGSVVLPQIPQGVKAKAFGVTLEDAAGSKTPTAPILLAGAAPQTGE
ncbi:MAG: anti-sigma factor [Acidobacteria bacterium]|nr:anti-sigma factor [Acidobacteriota bacterium]